MEPINIKSTKKAPHLVRFGDGRCIKPQPTGRDFFFQVFEPLTLKPQVIPTLWGLSKG